MKRQAKKRPQKVYVKKSADFDCMGRLHPRSIIWEDGRVYNIDSVTDFYPGCTSDHCGDRYTIIIKGDVLQHPTCEKRAAFITHRFSSYSRSFLLHPDDPKASRSFSDRLDIFFCPRCLS